MNKHIGVSKTIAWRPFIKRQTSRAKMKGNERGVNYLGHYVGKTCIEKIEKGEEERLGTLGNFGVSFSNTWKCM
jgi:hypothetical protein